MPIGCKRHRFVFLLRRRRIEVAGCQIPRVTAAGRHDENVMANPVAPFVPVTVEQSRQRVRRDRILVGGGAMTRVARLVGAVGKNIRHEGQRRTVRREDEGRLNATGDFRQLPHVAAVGVGEEDLRAGIANREECELPAVGRPARRVVGLFPANQQAGRRRAIRGHHPDVGVALPRRGIGRGPNERHHPTVGRELRI